MAKDAELDRLKAAQDLAFQRKQDAWKAMDDLGKRRASLRESMDRAYQEKQRAYEVQNASWEEYQRVRSNNGPRIDHLNSQQEAAFANMKRAFDSASAAHDRRDGASAKSYASQGHGYKAEAQGYVAERRRLVEEIRAARARHEATKPAFQAAKERLAQLKREYDRVKAEHIRARERFEVAKAEYDQAKVAFQKRLKAVKTAGQRKRDDKKLIAQRAGVPTRYLDDLWISRHPDGTVNIYFGGVGKPNGPGHGHYVVNADGKVTYRRDPFDPHGADNFETDEAYIAHQKSRGHSGGFGLSMHGYIGVHPVTVAFGWGTKQGHTLLADGHLTHAEFRKSRSHDHYGPGDGPNNNGTLRRAYTGPGA